jgi:hypothetical protein
MPLQNRKEKINPDDVVRDLEELYNTDINAFNEALDKLEEANPNLYEYCCNALDIIVDDDINQTEEE